MTPSPAGPAWLAPTARAVPWQALAAVAACLAGVVGLAVLLDRWPVGALDVAAAGLAAAVVAGLRDPAADLLAAVPTSALVRRLRRLALLVPAGLALWVTYLAAGHLWAPGIDWPVAPFLALAATGCAVAVWAPRRVAVEAGAAAPLVWLTLTRVGTTLDQQVQQLLAAYEHHPWIVTTTATAALLAGRDR